MNIFGMVQKADLGLKRHFALGNTVFASAASLSEWMECHVPLLVLLTHIAVSDDVINHSKVQYSYCTPKAMPLSV